MFKQPKHSGASQNWVNIEILGKNEPSSVNCANRSKHSCKDWVYSDLGNSGYLKIIAYSDAIHASLPSGAFQGAQIVFLYGNNRTVPIT